MIHTILLVFALVCFGFSAWQNGSPVWNRIVSVGLTALALSLIFGGDFGPLPR